MLKLQSTGKYQITGRGTVYTALCPIECDRSNPLAAFGDEVEIDGVVMKPIGIERFMLGPQIPIRVGEGIGILVAP